VYALWFAIHKENQYITLIYDNADKARAAFRDFMYMSTNHSVSATDNAILFTNNSKICFVSAQNAAKGSVKGHNIDLTIIDEAAWLDEQTFNNIIACLFPMCACRKTNQIILSSTVGSVDHPFFKLVEFAQTHQLSSFDITKVPWNCVPGRTKRWLKQMFIDLGEKFTQQEYLSEWQGSN